MDTLDKEVSKVVAAFSKAHVRGSPWVNNELLLATVMQDNDRGVQPRFPTLVSVRRDGEGMG